MNEIENSMIMNHPGERIRELEAALSEAQLYNEMLTNVIRELEEFKIASAALSKETITLTTFMDYLNSQLKISDTELDNLSHQLTIAEAR